MKTLEIEKIIKELEEAAYVKINPDFMGKEKIDVPILKQVDMLLDTVGEKGLKLTAKGNLPTKIVKEITLCCPTLLEERYLKLTKRYLEEEQVSVMRTRAVCEVGKLLKVTKGKIAHSSMSKAYMRASQAEKFIYLLWQFTKVNLGYFDRMQDESLSSAIALIMMQMVRDKSKMFRDAKVYTAFLLDAFPQLADTIEEEILPDSYFSEDPYDEFEHIVRIRLFGNFFIPFGLVEEQGVEVNEVHEYAKTALLEEMLLPFDTLDIDALLNKKTLHKFAQRIKKEGLEINLFHDFCYMYAHGARYPLKPVSIIVDDLIVAKKLIGTKAEKERAFYTDLAHGVEQTLRYFTQLEVKGGGSRGDEMQRQFQNWIDGLYALLPNNKPYTMIKEMRSVTFFFMDMLVNIYNIDVNSPDFYAACKEHFSNETIEDIGAIIFTVGELEKKGIKLKRVNQKLESMAKEVLMTFILGVMSIHTGEMDK